MLHGGGLDGVYHLLARDGVGTFRDISRRVDVRHVRSAMLVHQNALVGLEAAVRHPVDVGLDARGHDDQVDLQIGTFLELEEFGVIFVLYRGQLRRGSHFHTPVV